MKIFFTIAIFIQFTWPVFGQEAPLSAEDAIRTGLKHNFDIRIARNNASLAQQNELLGYGAFSPQLTLSGGYVLTDTETETNSPFSFGSTTGSRLTGAVNLNWTIFDGFKMFSDYSRYQNIAASTRLSARQTIELTVVQILQSYFDLVQQEQLLDVVSQTLEISKARLEKDEIRNELGASTSTELLNARVSFNIDRNQLLNQQLAVDNIKKQFNIILGNHPTTPVQVIKQINIPQISYSIDEIIQLAKENNVSLKLAKSNLAITKEEAFGTKSRLYSPNLSLNAGYGYTDATTRRSNNADITSETWDASVGLSLSFSPFNGFSDYVNVEIAEVNLKNQQLLVQQLELQVEALARERFDTFKQRLELVSINQENIQAAKQNLAVQQDKLSIGAVNSLEFRDAQVNLVQAQSNLINATYQARIALLQLEQLIGEIKID